MLDLRSGIVFGYGSNCIWVGLVESGLCKVWLTPRHLLALATATRLAIGEEGRPMNLEFSHFPSWRTILHPISEANELKLFIMFLVAAVIMPDFVNVTGIELGGSSQEESKKATSFQHFMKHN